MDSLDYPYRYVRAHQTSLTDWVCPRKANALVLIRPPWRIWDTSFTWQTGLDSLRAGFWDRVIQVGDLGFVKESMEGGELLVVSRTRFECSIYTLLASLGPELTGYVHVAQVLPQLFYGVDDGLSLGARLVVGQAYDIVQ